MNFARAAFRFDQWSRHRALVTQQRRRPFARPGPADAPPSEPVQSVATARADRVQAIREALAAGRYDVDARLLSLVSRFEQDPPPRPAA